MDLCTSVHIQTDVDRTLLRLGLAGFSAQQQGHLSAVVRDASAGSWQLGTFADADAWIVNGARVQILLDSTVRVASGEPGGRSLHLDLHDVDRPIAFSVPLAPRHFEPLYTFEARSSASVRAVLEKFEGWTRPFIAQFCLASLILEQESVLRPGIHHVSADGALIAVVNMQGETGVLPTTSPVDFENAMWERHSAPSAIPEHFVRSSLAQLMWQFAVRTSRDILPARYRTGLLYFRRPPRLAPRLMTDSHLLLMRELACAPADFESLQQRTGLGGPALARDLAALYFVGAITSNPRRAAPLPQRHAADSRHPQHSVLPSDLDSESPASQPRTAWANADLTAPARFAPS
jgi:hypothetical protein